MTSAQKAKQQRRKDRERRIKKQVNVRNNNIGVYRYQLDVEIDGKWVAGVKRFRTIQQVEEHIDSVEVDRKAGKEILPGNVFGIATGKKVAEIQGSKPKGSAPDKITDGPKADPHVTAIPATKPVEVVTVESDSGL